MEKQTRGGCWGGGPKFTPGLFQETPDVFQRAPASRDVHHRPDQIPNHMVQEAVGRDPQREPQLAPGFPTRFVNGATVPPLGLPRLGESLEGILSDNRLGRALEKHMVQSLGQGPAPVAVERRSRLCRQPETIEIRATQRIVSGMEVGGDGFDALDPDVFRKNSRQGLLEFFGLPRFWKGRDRYLSGRMDAAIGSSRSDHRPTGTRELLQGRLQLPLNGALFALDLPAVEGGSIILKNQLEAIVLHGVHARKVDEAQALSIVTPDPC